MHAYHVEHYIVVIVAQGYYDVDSFATAVAAALKAATRLSKEYTATFDAILGRIVLSNPLAAGHSMTLFTQESLRTADISN